MLNRLNNSEIHSFFADTLLRPESKLEWIDLWALSKCIRENEISDDLTLESILYGSTDAPVFSGFTEKRVRSLIEKFGSTELAISIGMHARSEAVLSHSKASPEKSQASLQKISRLRFREKRKQFRRKVREGLCRIREKFLFRTLPKNLKLNMGAGDETYPEYLKVDWAGPQHIFDNIISLDKIPANSVDEIYSNHVLEHIPISCIDPMLRRWHEVLKPGGVMRLRMPDAKQAVLKLGNAWSEIAESELLHLGFPNYLVKESERAGQVSEEMAIQFIYGWSDTMPGFWDMSNQHKSLWTPSLARARLEKCGFDVKLAQNFGTLQTIAIASKRK